MNNFENITSDQVESKKHVETTTHTTSEAETIEIDTEYAKPYTSSTLKSIKDTDSVITNIESVRSDKLKENTTLDSKPEKQTIEQLIEFRFKQSYDSRLCEYITGLRMDDPKIGERLAQDCYIIREKYRLPSREMRFDSPGEYERYLRQQSEMLGVKIKDKSACGDFFNDFPIAGGVYLDETKTIGININKESKKEYVKSISVLEHEFIHAKQDKYSPGMPTELAEYEAYIAGINPERVIEKPKDITMFLFGFFISGSVDQWYREKNMNRAKDDSEITPIWNNPEYFLKHVDNIDQTLIDAYKQKQSK